MIVLHMCELSDEFSGLLIFLGNRKVSKKIMERAKTQTAERHVLVGGVCVLSCLCRELKQLSVAAQKTSCEESSFGISRDGNRRLIIGKDISLAEIVQDFHFNHLPFRIPE
jgi:hypothetical protein